MNVNCDKPKPVKVLKQSLEAECHGSAPINKVPRRDATIDLDSLVMCSGSEERIWLKFNRLTLTEMDKLIIVKGVFVVYCYMCVVFLQFYYTTITDEMLTDKHINFALAILILQHQFNVTGLQSTLTVHKAKKMSPINACRMLQVLYCRGCHWIAVSTIQNFPQVMVYDSTYTFVDQDTQKLLKQLLGNKIDIRVGGQKQDDSVDCGPFAIATCVSLASGGQLHTFIQAKMRDHLVRCFENMNFTVFPWEY